MDDELEEIEKKGAEMLERGKRMGKKVHEELAEGQMKNMVNRIKREYKEHR